MSSVPFVSHKIHKYKIVYVDTFFAGGNMGGDYIKIILVERANGIFPDVIQVEIAESCVISHRFQVPVESQIRCQLFAL